MRVHIFKRDKAVVSASRHNCLKRRPAGPFGVVLSEGEWCCFGAVNRATPRGRGVDWCI